MSDPKSDASKHQPAAGAAASAAAGTAAPPAKQFTGYHSFMVNACKFTVDAKYQPLKPLGRGAYGVVWSARATSDTSMHEGPTSELVSCELLCMKLTHLYVRISSPTARPTTR